MQPPYNGRWARFGARMAPYIANANAIILCAVATCIIALVAFAVVFKGFPLRRASMFFGIALLFYAGAWAQLALVRLGRRLSQSHQPPSPRP